VGGDTVANRLTHKKVGRTEIIEGNAGIDHVHLVISIPPKFSIANTMGFLKGKSAILIHNRLSKNKKNPVWQKNFWSRGYFVRTVGIDAEVVKQYVREQWERDKQEDGDQMEFHW